MNPIFKREIQQFLKSGKIITTILSLVTLLAVFLYYLWPRTAVFSMASSESKQVFAVFLICNLAFVLVLVPAFCATSITSEKEKKSFIMLFTTLLKPHEILTGKLFASLSMISLLIICTMPVSSLCALSGGINLPLLLKAYLIIFVASCTFGIMSLAVSSLCEQSSAALIISYLLIALISGGTWLPYTFFKDKPEFLETLLTIRSLSPFDAIYNLLYPEQYQVLLSGESRLSNLMTFLITNSLITISCIMTFIYGFLYRSSQRSEITVTKVDSSTKRTFSRAIMYLYFFDPLRRKKPISNFMNPVFITELRSKVMGNPRFTIWAISICASLSIIIMILTSNFIDPGMANGFSHVQLASIIYQIGLVALIAPVVCSSSITTEVTSGTLLLVRMSRIGAVRFVLGKLYASLFYVSIILACSLPIIISNKLMSNESNVSNIYASLIIVLATTVCLVTAGLCASSFSSSTDSATAISYGFSTFLCLGTMAVLLFAENLSPSTVGTWLTINPITAALNKTNGLFSQFLNEKSWIHNLITLISLSTFFVILTSLRVYTLMRKRT